MAFRIHRDPDAHQARTVRAAGITRRFTGGKLSLLNSLLLLGALTAGTGAPAHAARASFAPMLVASTKPANGDVNPYGVAVVPRTMGNLTQGNILVSNFNNAQNLAGTGTTIVQISPDGTQSVFAQVNPNELRASCPGGGIGLTTALTVLSRGHPYATKQLRRQWSGLPRAS